MSTEQKNRAKPKVVLVHTTYDEETRIMSGWASELVSMLTIHKQLQGSDATSSNLRDALVGLEDSLWIAFYGHGTEEELLEFRSDDSSKPLVGMTGAGVQPPELAKHRVYAVACWAGSKLGEALWASGVEFIGYKYAFWLAPGFHHRFKEIVNAGLVAWVQGRGGRDVLQKLWDDWNTLTIQKRRPKAALHMGEELFVAVIAHWNRDALVYHGP